MRRHHQLVAGVLLAVGALVLASAPAFALDPYDPPTLSCVSSGENQITLKICAGASGAPAGVTVQWMEQSLYEAVGWLDSSDPRLCALSLSGQPSLQHPGASRWELLTGECEEIIIGDINFDETGVSGKNCGLDPLECGTTYVFRSFAHAGRRMGRSDFSSNIKCSTQPCPAEECTFTQGYWKTHGPDGCDPSGNQPNVWPVASLTLGTVTYNQTQLCTILNTAAKGNGLISLAHQLIAAKFNIAIGAGCMAVAGTIASADDLIGAKIVPAVGTGTLAASATSALTNTLNDFNNGILPGCPPHCAGSAPRFNAAPSTKLPWGGLKVRYR